MFLQRMICPEHQQYGKNRTCRIQNFQSLPGHVNGFVWFGGSGYFAGLMDMQRLFDGLSEFLYALVTVVRFFISGLADNGVKGLEKRCFRLFEPCLFERYGLFGYFAVNGLVENFPKRVDISALIRTLEVNKLFRGHVRRRALDFKGAGH